MIRKTIGVMLAVFMAVTCLGGCSGEDGSSTEPVHTGSGKKPEAHTLENTAEGSGEHRSSGSESATTVLKWAVWDLRTAPYWQAIADSYTAEHEDVRIEMEDLGSADYQTVLAKELSEEETEFDIVSMKDVPGYASLVSKGMLEPLSERAAADGLDLAAFNGTAEQVTVKGILYEMPFRSDFWLLYYNKDLFDDAGVDYPTNDMTIKEYDELARAAAGTDSSGSHIYGAHYHTWRSAVQLFGILDGQHSVLDGS